MKLKIQDVYDGKEKRFLQSISGEDVELLAQFTGKLDKVLHNKRVSYLWKKNQKETKEVSFEANASYLESVSCRIEVSVEECVEEKLMLEETDKHLQNLPVREYAEKHSRGLLRLPKVVPNGMQMNYFTPLVKMRCASSAVLCETCLRIRKNNYPTLDL